MNQFDFYGVNEFLKEKKKIPTLFNITLGHIQRNIDQLGYMGEIPDEIARKIVQKCTPEQFEKIEKMNPLIDFNSEKKWEVFTKKNFGGFEKKDSIKWRDFYKLKKSLKLPTIPLDEKKHRTKTTRKQTQTSPKTFNLQNFEERKKKEKEELKKKAIAAWKKQQELEKSNSNSKSKSKSKPKLNKNYNQNLKKK
ncbi:transcription elongation factor b polypeptide 3 [Anaeramoeba ignava]|uniref:Transcription elongation factor b polypeptide 3 n=1 Tax=Anaeramoeba ignava TaxID=1746090 RepID=A0A9Q0LW31_ANAIG|nr:transcription elongation factor b polypeptide 3 [Anaeramoeba ignava]